MTGSALFTEKELAYINAQRLARVATVSPQGQPDVAVVGFRFDGHDFFVGGRALERTLKHQNVKRGSAAALVLDDLSPERDGEPRGLKVHGTADIVARPDRRGVIRITPLAKWSWGIEEPTFREDGSYVLNSARADAAASPFRTW